MLEIDIAVGSNGRNRFARCNPSVFSRQRCIFLFHLMMNTCRELLVELERNARI